MASVYERVFTRGANRAGDNYSRQVAKMRSKEEVRRTVVEAPGEWSSEEIIADDGEDVDQSSPLRF